VSIFCFQHINDMSMAIHLEESLKKAEGIFLQLKNAKHLPDGVKEILGFPTASVSSSPAGSRGSSGTSTPVIPHTPANTPVNVAVNAPVNATLTVGYSKENSARLHLPEFLRDNGQKSNSGNASPDDSSIEILSDNCNSGTSNYYN
jgi:hypothetical protein